jgi:hypothetical protein
MFHCQDCQVLGQFTILKKEIKCGGIQQIEFGKINLNNLEKPAFKIFFVRYIYKWQELTVVAHCLAQCLVLDQWLVAAQWPALLPALLQLLLTLLLHVPPLLAVLPTPLPPAQPLLPAVPLLPVALPLPALLLLPLPVLPLLPVLPPPPLPVPPLLLLPHLVLVLKRL